MAQFLTLITLIEDLFARFDAQTLQFAKDSGLACPPRCGACCQTPDMEASAAEMLPMAYQLWCSGEAEALYDRLRNHVGPACFFFQAYPEEQGAGRCTLYEKRPSLCRLFGYVAFQTKHKTISYRGCRRLQTDQAQLWQDVQEFIAEGHLVPPLMACAQQELADLTGGLYRERMPLARALAKAIEILSLQLSWESASRDKLRPPRFERLENHEASHGTGKPSHSS